MGPAAGLFSSSLPGQEPEEDAGSALPAASGSVEAGKDYGGQVVASKPAIKNRIKASSPQGLNSGGFGLGGTATGRPRRPRPTGYSSASSQV